MKFLKKIIRKVYTYIYYMLSLVRIIFESLIYKNRIYLFGIPIHGNLGDQAILYAEEEFLKENFENLHVIEIESNIVRKFSKLLKLLVKDNVILVHGGGFLGTLWLNEEIMFRTVLENFPNNNVIVFPQTAYFSNDEDGKKILNESQKIYAKHKKLYICCREKYSYDFMKKNFSSCNILLIPDMVLYLNGINNNKDKKNVLFCIRNDKEKVKYDFDNLKSKLSDFTFTETDMVVQNNIYLFNRKKHLYNKINEFSNYKLIITDRLHGMVFSLLAGVPCLVFENKSYKIKGVYEWISDIDSVRLYNENTLDKDISELLELNYNYTNKKLKSNYKELIKLIKKSL